MVIGGESRLRQGYRDREGNKQWHDLNVAVFVRKRSIPDKADEAFKDVQRAMWLAQHKAKQ